MLLFRKQRKQKKLEQQLQRIEDSIRLLNTENEIIVDHESRIRVLEEMVLDLHRRIGY